MPWLAPVVAPIAGGVVGNLLSHGERGDAQKAQQEAVQQWLSVNVPDPAQQKVELQRYLQTGSLSPQLQQAMKLGPSAMDSVHADAGLQGAQLSALSSLQNEGMQGGLGLQDKATLAEATNQANSAAKGRNDALTQNFAQRGQGGSGLELAAKLQNNQYANQNAGMNSLRAAADARTRALSSVMGAGQLGGQMQQQHLAQANTAARAADAISRFNTENAQSVSNANTGIANDAQKYNLGLKQNLSNMNTGIANQENLYNKGLIQQNFDNQARKAAGVAGADESYGNFQNKQADATAGMWAGIGSGLGKLGSAYNASSKDDGYGGGSARGANAGMYAGSPEDEEDQYA